MKVSILVPVYNERTLVRRSLQAVLDAPLPENESVEPQHVVHLRKGLSRDQVREGAF